MDDFGLAVEAHRKRLMASAMKLCRDTDQAEDLVQETMMRAIRNQHLFEPGSNLAGWLYTIMRNQFFSDRRRDGRIVADADDLLSRTVPAREDHAAAYEAKEALSFLVLIPLHMRRALLLRPTACRSRRSPGMKVWPTGRSRAASTAAGRCSPI